MAWRRLNASQSQAVLDYKNSENKLDTKEVPLGANRGDGAYQNQISQGLPEFNTIAGNNALFGGMMGGDRWADVGADAAAGLVTFNPLSRIDQIESRFPELGVRQFDYEGSPNAIITNQEGDQAILNKPGLSNTDVAPFVGAAVASTPAGRAAMIPTTLGKKMLMGGGAETATDIGLQMAERDFGGDQPYDPARSAMGFAGGAVGGGAIHYGGKWIRQKQATKNALLSGTGDVDAAGYQLGRNMLEPTSVLSGVKKFRPGQEAMKQGVDKSHVAAIGSRNPGSSPRMHEMLDMTEAGRKNLKTGMNSHPNIVVGESIMDRVTSMNDSRKRIGKQLEAVRKQLVGVTVDSAQARNEFMNKLESMGISAGEDGLDFSASELLDSPSAGVVKKAYNFLELAGNDASELHILKQRLSKLLYNNSGMDKSLDPGTKTIISNLRDSVNKSIGAIDTPVGRKYAELNQGYSELKGTLTDFYKRAGSMFDPYNDAANEHAGQLVSRRMLSNDMSSPDVKRIATELEVLSRKHGATFSDDIQDLVVMSDAIDAYFPTLKTRAFQGQITRAIDKSNSGLVGMGKDAAKKGYTELRGIDEEGLFNSLRGLLEDASPPKPSPLSTGGKRAIRSPGGKQAGHIGSQDLPMDEASRMQRARDMGFDTDNTVYHATGNNVDAFSFGDPNAITLQGTHVGTADQAKDAITNKFALDRGIKDGVNTMPLYVKNGNYLRLEDGMHWENGVLAQELADMGIDVKSSSFLGEEFYKSKEVQAAIKRHGYDGIVYQNLYEGDGVADSLIVFDPENLRSKFAKFDPAKKDSSNLLANFAGLAGTGAAGAYGTNRLAQDH